MSSSPVYVGIDVACAIGKRLPICFVSAGRPTMPLAIPAHLSAGIPRGRGNKEIIQDEPFREAARGVVRAIKLILDEMGWEAKRIAVDAPAASPATGSRASENDLGRFGLSSFRTPSKQVWPAIRQKCVDHLSSGGTAATLPHANKIWMLFGFELFASLRRELGTELIEVYPFAIVRQLLPTCEHKSTHQGYHDQLNAIADRTGWEPKSLQSRLKGIVPGNRHDRLDAFMAAWVASLSPDQTRAFGDPGQPNDSVWVPL